MTRRQLLWHGVAGLAALSMPSLARAARPWRVALLFTGTPESNGYLAKAFVGGMRSLGYVEGRDVVYAYAWAGGRTDRYDSIASELARGAPDVVVTGTAAATRAAAAAAPAAAVIMAYGSDPVGNKLVASLARPGGRITGLSNLGEGIVPKMLEILCEVSPKARRIFVLVNPTNLSTAAYMTDADAAAAKLKVVLVQQAVGTPDAIGPAIASVVHGRADAIVVTPDPMFLAARRALVEAVDVAHLPAIYFQREFVVDGGLMSYGSSIRDSFARAAFFVDKVLKGTDPGMIPVEQPTTFELTLNAHAAKVLGLAIPASFLARASEVIR